ncbi:MAG: heme-binding protein [Pseudomonadota bacterium]
MRSLVAALAVLVAPLSAAAYEEPAHTVELEEGKFEIRTYEPVIVASVIVNATGREAANLGFRPLADYIFGNNTARADIDMTAPVTQRAVSQKIDMTVPVTQTAANGSQTMISFVMPSEWTMETLPEPNNDDVILAQMPARRVASMMFRGGGSDRQQAEAEASLRDWLETKGLEPLGVPTFNFYSGPWVPGPFRKNEVHLEIAPAGG